MFRRQLSLHVRAALQQARELSTSPQQHTGFIECRKYTLIPDGMKSFMKLSETYSDLRRELIPGFLGMFVADTGGVLNEVIHFYHYPDHATRDATRRKLAAHRLWQDSYVDHSRKFVSEQRSEIFHEASELHAAAGSPSAHEFRSPPRGENAAVYELRKYQLSLGYNPVPELRKEFAKGLPAKVSVDTEGKLVMLAYSDIGELNQVMELWRYPSVPACIEARQKSRGVAEWRTCIAKIAPMVQSFSTTVLNPVPFSPWQ